MEKCNVCGGVLNEDEPFSSHHKNIEDCLSALRVRLRAAEIRAEQTEKAFWSLFTVTLRL